MRNEGETSPGVFGAPRRLAAMTGAALMAARAPALPIVLVATALSILVAEPALAQSTVGSPAIYAPETDGCGSCTFVLNQAFGQAGLAVNNFTFYANATSDITPLLLNGINNGDGTITFSIAAIGQTQTAALGVNSFAFGTATDPAQAGVNLTGLNSYFGFSVQNGGVVAYDYFDPSTSSAISTFLGPYDGTFTASLGASFTDSYSTASGGYNALNLRDYSINAVASAVAAVPEPATWAMMIGGFGLVGASMRRRKSVVVAAALA